MKKNSILLVEDNPHEEVLATRILEQQGIFSEVVVAHDGAEALENLLQDGDQGDKDQVEMRP